MKSCQFCLPTLRTARYEIVPTDGAVVLTCAKHAPYALHNIQSNSAVRPLAEDGSYLFTEAAS